MPWPLTWVMIVGTLPGGFIGYSLRVPYLPAPRSFKFIVGLVLLSIDNRLLYEMTERSQRAKKGNEDARREIQSAREEAENGAGGARERRSSAGGGGPDGYLEPVSGGVRGLGRAFHLQRAGVFFYCVMPVQGGLSCAPDWILGFPCGVRDFGGMYLGARLPKCIPRKYLKLFLGIIIMFLAGSYIVQDINR